jgi:hypothetical protein
MNKLQNIERRLWEYIDNTNGVNEKITVRKLIETGQTWSKKFQELLSIHQLIIDSSTLEKPAPGFLQKVMNKINAIG